GPTASNRSRAWAPSRATWTRKPSRRSPMERASTKLSSSSTTRTVVSACVLITSVLSTRFLDRRRRAHGDRPGPSGHAEREGRPGPFTRRHGPPAAMVGGDVAHDREPEAGTPCLAAARPVDPVEPLEDAIEVTRRDADPVIAHVDVDPRSVGARRHLDDRTGVGVLHAVLAEVGHRRHQLAPIPAGVDP